MISAALFLFALLAFFIIAIVVIDKVVPDKSADYTPQLIQQIDQLLPQTQCGHCGYKGCLPYAEAVANGEAINRCAPGGDETIHELAALLNRPFTPLDTHKRPPAVAFIREEECIGCTKCIQACPVDAIIGAATFMHTVIEQDCTGCDLCVDACPVDCIDMVFIEAAADKAEKKTIADKARDGYEKRNIRVEKEEQERQAQRLARQKQREQARALEEDPVAKALAQAKARVSEAVTIEEEVESDEITLLRQRIQTLEDKLIDAKSPAKEVMESTLAKMRQELKEKLS